MKKDSVIILSGGIDSITLLYAFVSRIGLAISYRYCSKNNNNELRCASYHASKLGIAHMIVDLDFFDRFFRSSILLSGGDIPKNRSDTDAVKKVNVPFRNGIFLAVAAGIAESYGYQYVMIANHREDQSPDSKVDFIEAMSVAMQLGTYRRIKVSAPFSDKRKSDLIRIGVGLGIDYNSTWSCYDGGALHCGVCPACLKRKQAFRDAGLLDPTKYEV